MLDAAKQLLLMCKVCKAHMQHQGNGTGVGGRIYVHCTNTIRFSAINKVVSTLHIWCLHTFAVNACNLVLINIDLIDVIHNLCCGTNSLCLVDAVGWVNLKFRLCKTSLLEVPYPHFKACSSLKVKTDITAEMWNENRSKDL